jgi:hypothetical protein
VPAHEKAPVLLGSAMRGETLKNRGIGDCGSRGRHSYGLRSTVSHHSWFSSAFHLPKPISPIQTATAMERIASRIESAASIYFGGHGEIDSQLPASSRWPGALSTEEDRPIGCLSENVVVGVLVRLPFLLNSHGR